MVTTLVHLSNSGGDEPNSSDFAWFGVRIRGEKFSKNKNKARAHKLMEQLNDLNQIDYVPCVRKEQNTAAHNLMNFIFTPQNAFNHFIS